MTHFRNICFTLNNYTQEEYDFLFTCKLFRYAILGKEIGESDTPHIQGYAVLTKRMRLNALKKELGNRIHFESRKGTHEQARDYCKKDDNYVEIGEPPKQGNRTDLAIAIDTLKNNGLKRVAEEHPEVFVKYSRGLRDLNLILTDRYDHCTVKGIWLFGPSGTGKTHSARHFDPNAYMKAQNKWWDGYDGEQTVILDDLDTNVLGHYLKIWADKWSCTGETKGGTVQLRHRLFVVTSNYSIEQLFNQDIVLAEAIARRFKQVEKLDKSTIVDYLILK